MQNRKSARKCRMKKKEEFSVIKDEVVELRNENKSLKDKVSFYQCCRVKMMTSSRPTGSIQF
jgi:hypothetical protein